MDEAPTWTPAAEAVYWLNEVEKMQGGDADLGRHCAARDFAGLTWPVTGLPKASPVDWRVRALVNEGGKRDRRRN